MVRSALLLACVFATVAFTAPVPEAPLPDLIVADLRIVDGMIVLEVQNQGPGVFPKGTTTKARIETPRNNKLIQTEVTILVPTGLFEVSEIRIPVANFGTNDPKELGPMFSVVLDPDKKLEEERPGNNEYYRQVDQDLGRRGNYRQSSESRELPEIVVTNITADKDYVYVHYKNIGKGVTGADFLVRFSHGDHAFDGNYFYRFTVPPPGMEMKTGGLTLGLIGLKPGDEAKVTATIDYENRVRQSSRKNNTFTKVVKIPAQ
jgi:hypothetical protein